MRILLFMASIAMFCMACGPTNYETEELYGTWQGENMGFVFNEDGSCEYTRRGEKWPGDTKWRAVFGGNSLEITANGKVIMANLTIKSLKDDVLTLETRKMVGNKTASANSHELKRVN